MILSLQNLTVCYGNFIALRDVSFTLEPGMIGLLGPNGAGKSTLIKTILGLLPVKSGNIEVLGHSVCRENITLLRQKIGYVPEGDCYLHGVSPVHFIAFLSELTGMASALALKRAHEVLEYVGLGEERYRKLEELSFGQRSRVKLAQALVHNVELLILDEPTDGMDPIGKEHFFSIIKNIQKDQKLSILLATHNLEDVEAICPKTILLYQGKLLTIQNWADWHQNTQNSYVLEVSDGQIFCNLAQRNGLIAKEIGVNKVLISDCQDTQKLFALLQQAGLQIWSLLPWRPTLEEIFMQVLRGKSMDLTLKNPVS